MKNLDCLLIWPPTEYSQQNVWKEVNSNFPPLGLASIAAYIRSKKHTVRIIDCNIEAPSVEEFETYFCKEILPKYQNIRFIGFGTMTCNIKKAYKLAEFCKKHYPNTKTIFGGVHTTFVTEEVIQNPNVDIAVIGEGEITTEEIIAGKPLDQIKGIVCKNTPCTIGFSDRVGIPANRLTTPPRERITNLDQLPMPAYDLLPITKYRPAKGTYKKLPAMSMMTSRGCPGRCTFCTKTLGNQLVFRSAKNIIKEIKYLQKHHGIQEILFYDDTFTVNNKNVTKMCNTIIKQKIKLSWTCFARVDFINQTLLNLMKKAGCHQIMYGVESVDETVLKNINKKINPEQVTKAVEWTKKAGIECRLAFMVGNPGDTQEIIQKNTEFAKHLNPDLIIINITTPFPGTEMFKWAKEKNLILTYDWDQYNLANPVMKLENMTEEQIKDLYKTMYKGFYIRPKFMIKKLFSIRSTEDIKILLGGAKALLSFLKRT